MKGTDVFGSALRYNDVCNIHTMCICVCVYLHLMSMMRREERERKIRTEDGRGNLIKKKRRDLSPSTCLPALLRTLLFDPGVLSARK